MCLGAWQRISQPPILRLNAEHPLGDGFGSLQNGKSIFAEGVIGGLGEKKFCAERGGCACATSRGAKFCIFFHSLFVCDVQWENMNGSIFIRGAVHGKTPGWGCFSGECMWVRRCGCKCLSVEKPRRDVHPSVTHARKLAFIKRLCYLTLSAAPAESPAKQRSFSLTWHQLRALTQLAGTLLGFERTVRELLADATSVEITGETPGGRGTIYVGFRITCVNINPIRPENPPFFKCNRKLSFWTRPHHTEHADSRQTSHFSNDVLIWNYPRHFITLKVLLSFCSLAFEPLL